MLRDFPRVRRWEESGDVCQNAAVRLGRALDEVRPPTARDFFRLAALQIRRELLNLAEPYYGPHGHGARQLRQEPALAELRSRDGFEQLLSEIEAKPGVSRK
jgi:hypothetical protein